MHHYVPILHQWHPIVPQFELEVAHCGIDHLCSLSIMINHFSSPFYFSSHITQVISPGASLGTVWLERLTCHS